jgi:hypothetical protein
MNAHISASANIFQATHYTPTAMSTRRPPEAPVCETASIMQGVQFKPPSSMVHTDNLANDISHKVAHVAETGLEKLVEWAYRVAEAMMSTQGKITPKSKEDLKIRRLNNE